MTQNEIIDDRHRKIATEGALIGSIVDNGLSDELVIVSDDAGQFNVLCHALCWVHAERLIGKIVPYTDQARDDLENVKDQLWDLYKDLKAYKLNPHSKAKQALEEAFDTIFTKKQPAQPSMKPSNEFVKIKMNSFWSKKDQTFPCTTTALKMRFENM